MSVPSLCSEDPGVPEVCREFDSLRATLEPASSSLSEAAEDVGDLCVRSRGAVETSPSVMSTFSELPDFPLTFLSAVGLLGFFPVEVGSLLAISSAPTAPLLNLELIWGIRGGEWRGKNGGNPSGISGPVLGINILYFASPLT